MNEGIGPEIELLREKKSPDHAWVIFQVILGGYVQGYPDGFIELIDPIERIFLIRHGAFHYSELQPNASKSVAEVLNSLSLDQRELLEKNIVPIITQAFNISRIVDSMHSRGARRHH